MKNKKNNQPCPFDEFVNEREKHNVKGLTEVNLYNKTKDLTPHALIKFYLACKWTFGLLGTLTISVFLLLIEKLKKDDVLQETFEIGKDDGKKRRPFKFFKTTKESCAYETGRHLGEKDINKKQ